jgi:putative aminopeptidase FrvX
MTLIELIRKLVESYGPSGHEDQIRALILQEIEGLADEVNIDPMGSVIAWRRSGDADAPRVMLSAHMDEIGVMVTHLDKDGFLRFTAIGGVDVRTLLGNRVRFADGTIGVIHNERQGEDRGKAPAMESLFIDVSDGSNTPSRIRVGDAAGMYREMVQQGTHLIAKSMDDRIGCALQIGVMQALQGQSIPNDIAFVFSTQEEVGIRGARTAAYGVDPHLGIAIDVTATGDTPKGLKMEVAVGKGPAIKIKDSGMMAAPEVIDLMEQAAQRANVPYQREVLLGGTTDAASMQLIRAGVRSGCLSIPCRYVHTTSETVDIRDVENGVKLLAALLELRIETAFAHI